MLRFFKDKNLREVAAALNVNEAAAQRRVHRAVEKLRGFFTKRGGAISSVAITGAISANSVQAAPVALVKSVTTVAIAKGSIAAASTITLVKGAMNTMTWLKIKLAVGVGAAVMLTGGMATIAFSQSQPTVYSLLEKTPIVANATFEKEINIKTLPPNINIPAGAQKQSFTFALDGEDYRMDFGGGMVGRFTDTDWQTMGKQVMKFSSKWNKPDGESGGITAGNSVARGTINLLITSGITTANPKNIVWEAGHRKMTFEGDEEKKYVVEFTEENGLPVSAIVVATDHGSSTGMPDGILIYRYDSHFFEGRLPIEIVRYYGNTVNEDAKAFAIRIQSLKISNGHLPSTDLDPDKLIKTTNPNFISFFYSNNIPYWTDAKGKVSRVLTVEENNKEIERIKAASHSTTANRRQIHSEQPANHRWIWLSAILIISAGAVITGFMKRKRGN
jgi:hypothetical protein